MTADEREQVVELLRCAADLSVTGRARWPQFTAAEALCGAMSTIAEYAEHAISAVKRISSFDAPTTQHLLEAAARVEEGTWP
jgi:hypothetical protein